MNTRIKQIGALALIAMLAFSAPAAALNFSDDAQTPNPYIGDTVEKQSHNTANFDSPLAYEADDGSTATLNARLNPNSQNPISYAASEVDYGQGQFPADDGDNTASSLDASEWLPGQNVSVTDTTTADTVNGVNIATDGTDFTSGDVAFSSYENFSITSDENKRFLTLVGNVNQLESGARVDIQVTDADGDIKRATIDPSADASADNVVANQTGEGFVYQIQLGELTTSSTPDSDGQFNDIERVGVVTQNGDSDVTFTDISIDDTRPVVFGEERYDSNGDGEVTSEDDTRSVTNVNAGEHVAITSVDSMGASFDDATIYNMRVDVQFDASNLDSEDVNASAEETDSYPGYDVVADVHYRLSLPDAYDLTHTNTALAAETKQPGERYLTVEYAEGVGSTDFASIDYSNDVTGQFDAQGQTVTLDNTVQPGQEIAVHFQMKLTQSEWDAMNSDDGSAIGPTGKEGGSGLTSLPVIGGLIAVLLGIAAKLRGGSE